MSDTEEIISAGGHESGDEVDENNYEEEGEEIDAENSDPEDSADEETAKLPLQPPSVELLHHKKASTPTPSPGGSRKKVQPTESVKNAPMESPDSLKKKNSAKLNPDKNPFETNGVWNADTLSQIEIAFPTLTGKNESTNDLTRRTRPEARYWKAPIVFKFSTFTSTTLRFDNVQIPFHTGKGYGETYIYMVLPSEAADAFAEAGKKVAPTKVIENSLMPDKQRWWKIANKVEGVFGIVTAGTNKWTPKSLATIFASTNSGITASVVLSFSCKASTDEMAALRPTTARHISVEIARAYINDIGVNVQMPQRVSRHKPTAEPAAVRKDIASDDLMQRLSELGL